VSTRHARSARIAGDDGEQMAGEATNHEQDLSAGVFSEWLPGALASMRGEQGSDVPCDGCTACCTSGYPIRIGAAEVDVVARIPPEHLVSSPGLPDGDVIMVSDARGHCPMLVDDRCTIYEHRPQTCRAYDCRVLAAAGLSGGADDGPLVARRVRHWRFEHPTPADHARHAAVQAAAAYLGEHAAALPGVPVELGETRRAAIAVQLHDLFLAPDPGPDGGTAGTETIEPSLPAVRRALFDRQTDPRARWARREGDA
jgi:uncharacterized protein